MQKLYQSRYRAELGRNLSRGEEVTVKTAGGYVNLTWNEYLQHLIEKRRKRHAKNN